MAQCPAELEIQARDVVLYCRREEGHRGQHQADEDAVRRVLPSGGSVGWSDPPAEEGR